MSGIFVSYRRDDAAGWAGRLVSDLRKRFDAGHVFHDIAAIDAGSDFTKAIERALGSCAVALVVIGPGWLGARDRRGAPRLAQLDDPVRVEIRLALSRADLLVVPVLVGGAAMPSRDDLPDDINALSTRHAAELSDSRWDFDVEKIVGQLESVQGVAPLRKKRRTGVVVAIGLAGLAAIALVWYVRHSSNEGEAQPVATAASAIAVERRQPFPKEVEKPPITTGKPEVEAGPNRETTPPTKRDPPRSPTAAKPMPAGPGTARVELDGLWEATYPDAQGEAKREKFEFETRRGDVFGSNWVHGAPRKFAVLEGKVEEDRLKFCIQVPSFMRKGEGFEHFTYRECFDGIVARDEIRFVATNYIGHPSRPPETRRFTAGRVAR